MHINEILFMKMRSRAIHFRTAKLIKNEKEITIITVLQQVIATYQARGFQVQHILIDRQFKHTRKLREEMGIMLNITGHDEHVLKIERYIRNVKERVQATVNTLPFKIY